MIQYCVYPTERVGELFKYITDLPQMAADKKKVYKYSLAAYFEEMRIHLPTRKVTTERNMNYAVEFPVVSNHLVGKEWRYTYASLQEDYSKPDTYLNGVCRYDRQTKTAEIRKFGMNNSLSEPVLVENQTGSYLLTIVYHSDIDKSMVHILDAVTLEDIFVA